ncbi:MAG: hypothetical protein ACYTKD_01220 [Planctomycetota bacterium]|jgi:hypothetical protein
MREYTQDELDALVTCKKVVTDPPTKKMRSSRGHLRNDFRLCSEDGESDFSVFIRVNERFPENFTVGLGYHPRDERGSFCLLRYNGPHGPYEPEGPEHHATSHIHRALATNIVAGKRPEAGAQPTTKFASSYQDALRSFMNDINVPNTDKLFPGISQMLLFD